MRISAIGTAGFIGSYLCEKLANLNHQVASIDSFKENHPAYVKEQNVIHMMRLDLVCDPLQAALSNAGIVYHLAAQSGLPPQASPAIYQRTNPLATQTLLKAYSAIFCSYFNVFSI